MPNIFRSLIVAVAMELFIMRPAISYADWQQNHSGNWPTNNSGQNHSNWQAHSGGQGHDSGHHDNGHHDRDHGHSYIGVGFSFVPDSYYYDASYYSPSDEVLVSPPVYQPVIINGTTYYLNDGVYYVYNGYSYQPVAPPVTVIQPPTVVQPPVTVVNQAPSVSPAIITPAATGDVTDSITINIPNDKGGYTAVTLKKSGNGYIGPQGEFYPNFPTVYKLKIIYGKSS